MRTRLALALAAVTSVAAAGPAHAAPKIDQLVVFKNGGAVQKRVTASSVSVKLGKKRCTVGGGTALAGLLRSRIGAIQLHDYGACSKHAVDAAGLYVKRIRNDAARAANGWVYKVGNKVATAGAGDRGGPFGNGLLKSRARVTWFYCRMGSRGCQRTLVVKAKALGAGRVRVTVRAYDDRGKSRAASRATVHLRNATAKTNSSGVATLTTTAGSAHLYARAKGVVRSFTELVQVK